MIAVSPSWALRSAVPATRSHWRTDDADSMPARDTHTIPHQISVPGRAWCPGRTARAAGSGWAVAVRERRGYWKAVVALAARNTRMCWAMLQQGESFKPPA